ncbi:MAG: hypothetical protein II559_01440 [Muribaculaceae bacterium]|nr:hypothetical protein [Muribaculaceae bacterium]MBQ2562067.1 hypothetical protein [Muribaculaceae bacterium]MBQ5508258.1 hypothetical protein [Muribaculaceae bacterium]
MKKKRQRVVGKRACGFFRAPAPASGGWERVCRLFSAPAPASGGWERVCVLFCAPAPAIGGWELEAGGVLRGIAS